MSKITTILAAGAALSLSACASILSESTYPVTFDSDPTGAQLRITDEAGNVVFDGRGPTTLSLKAGDGYFSGARYTVAADMNGTTTTATLTPSMDGWYVGNVLFGGLIGLLVVDPMTGAMYKLPEQFTVSMDGGSTETSLAPTANGRLALNVVAIDDVPADLRGELVRID